MVIIVLLLALTFVLVSIAGILAKKYGVEYLIALASALIVIANIFANKIIQFGPFTVSAGVIAFSMIFLITDLISEKWGKAQATKAVWAGFFSSFVLIILTYIVLNWAPAEYAIEISETFSKALALTPRIAIASFIAYLISQHYDIWSFHFLKQKTKGKHLWLRNNLSTIVSQFFDSIIFVTIAFYGVFPILPLITGLWAVKIIIALLDTPFLYATIWLMNKFKK